MRPACDKKVFARRRQTGHMVGTNVDNQEGRRTESGRRNAGVHLVFFVCSQQLRSGCVRRATIKVSQGAGRTPGGVVCSDSCIQTGHTVGTNVDRQIGHTVGTNVGRISAPAVFPSPREDQQ